MALLATHLGLDSFGGWQLVGAMLVVGFAALLLTDWLRTAFGAASLYVGAFFIANELLTRYAGPGTYDLEGAGVCTVISFVSLVFVLSVLLPFAGHHRRAGRFLLVAVVGWLLLVSITGQVGVVSYAAVSGGTFCATKSQFT